MSVSPRQSVSQCSLSLFSESSKCVFPVQSQNYFERENCAKIGERKRASCVKAIVPQNPACCGKIRCVAAVESVFSRSSELSEAYGLPVVENPVLSSVRAVLLWYTVSRRYVRTVQEVHFLRKASRVH